MANNPEIHDRLSRVEEILKQFDAYECNFDGGTALQEKGQKHLMEVRELLDEGSGEVVVLE